jgi:formyl-CoA transferase
MKGENNMEHTKIRGPLRNVRILDLSTMIAAPFGATLLGDFGAEVIKVEIPGSGDSLRTMGPFKDNEPLRWTSIARNKKSLTLDLRHEEGKKILKKLVRISDVIIENFRPGTLEKWGLGYDILKRENKDLIMMRVTGYGQTGPNSHKAGFGTPATAYSGYTYLHGFPDRPPISPSFSLLDYITGIYVAFAVSVALYYSEKNDDEGQEIDIGLYESVFRMMDFLVSDYDQNGNIKERSPGLSGHSAPAGTFQTKDGEWVVLVTSSDSTFKRLAKAMKRLDLLEDKRFHTNSVRLKHFDLINDIVSKWVKQYSRDNLQRHLDAYGVPVSPINSIEDIFKDEHYKERQNIIEVDHPRLGKVKVPGIVPKFSRTPGGIQRIAPDLGEHTDSILNSLLGYSEKDIEKLKARNII